MTKNINKVSFWVHRNWLDSLHLSTQLITSCIITVLKSIKKYLIYNKSINTKIFSIKIFKIQKNSPVNKSKMLNHLF